MATPPDRGAQAGGAPPEPPSETSPGTSPEHDETASAQSTAPPASGGSSRRAWVLVGVTALAIGCLSGTLAALGVGGAIRDHYRSVVIFSANQSVFPRMGDVPSVLEKVLPAIVSINATLNCSTATGAPSIERVAGTGMVLTSNGYILTNDHVVAGALTMTVTLTGHSTALPATLVGADPNYDVALIKVLGATSLPVVHFGDSQQVAVGQPVLAIGNALALSETTPTVTSGIISAEGRDISAEGECKQPEELSDLLQTQAPINSGNSGGALVDDRGLVIGMNTAAATSAPGDPRAQNIGFAIPTSDIEALLPGLRNGGSSGPHASYIGIEAVTLTPDIRAARGLLPSLGVLVESVLPGSPAVGRLRPNDVIVSYDGTTVTSAGQLALLIEGTRSGASVPLRLWRGRSQLVVTVVVGSR